MSAPIFEVFVLVDSNGDYAVGNDADAAREKYAEDIGDLTAVDGFRLVKLSLAIPLPEPLEMSAAVPALPAPGPLTLAVS